MRSLLDPALRLGVGNPRREAGEFWADRIRSVLLTRPGTLPWRPQYGFDIEWLLGQPLNTVNVTLLRMRLRSTLARWLPDLKVNELKIAVHSDHRALVQSDRYVPPAEAALLPYGSGGRVEILLDVTTPSGPLEFGMNLDD